MTIDEQGTDTLSPDVFRAQRHHEVFARLRAEDPVHRTVDSTGKAFWSITKHADVQQANRDSETFTVLEGFTLTDFDEDDVQGQAMREILPGLDGEQHTRYRRIVNRGFTPRTLRLIEDHFAWKARTLVDHVIERGEGDFVVDIAAELPIQAISELVGVPDEDRQLIFDWSNQCTGIDDPEFEGDLDNAVSTAAEMIAYADGLRQQRQRDPRDDIITKLTKLTNAEVEGGALTDAEFGMFFLLLVIAGNDTTRNATSHGMRALIDNPDELAKLRADPSRERMERAVEEILRWASPILYFRRTATRDVELSGTTIEQGDRVVLWYPSANRDEEVFTDPFRFDVDRTPNDHVTFGGGGPHFCLGANLARMELRLVFTELVTRMTDIELAGPVDMLRSNFIGGIKHMPIRWRAR